MAKRSRKANYALKGDIELSFHAESDEMALSRAQNEVCRGPYGLTKLYRLGRAVDEPLFWLEKAPEYLCQTGRM